MDKNSNLTEWKVVRSRSDKHSDFGYPLGNILCRNQKEAQDYVKNSEFKDCYISEYHNMGIYESE